MSEASAVLAEAPWDLVCANQLANWPQPGRYRDTFALKEESYRENPRLPKPEENLFYSGNKLLPVKSCFSGLALYSMHAIVSSGCNYEFEDEKICEHVTFNR